MSGKGNCYDNAAVETFFKTIKAELIWRDTWGTRRQAEMAIFKYINDGVEYRTFGLPLFLKASLPPTIFPSGQTTSKLNGSFCVLTSKILAKIT
jgi:hypothetical protein